jgi:hypothetical protein
MNHTLPSAVATTTAGVPDSNVRDVGFVTASAVGAAGSEMSIRVGNPPLPSPNSSETASDPLSSTARSAWLSLSIAPEAIASGWAPTATRVSPNFAPCPLPVGLSTLTSFEPRSATA